MPISVYYKNDPSELCTIRPTPFIQIAEEVLKNKEGSFGVTYNITLTGTLLPDLGTPFAINPQTDTIFDFMPQATPPSNFTGPYGTFESDDRGVDYYPPKQKIIGAIDGRKKRASAILSKQRALRALFAQDGQKVELMDIIGETAPTIVCFPRVVSIDFEANAYVTKCSYTIVLQADFLLRGNFADEALLVDAEGTLVSSGVDLKNVTGATIQSILDSSAFIESYEENWGLEVDDTTGESVENPRSYRISHNLSAVGKTVYANSENEPNRPAWQQAKDFVLSRLASNPSGYYPNIAGQIGSGTVNLAESYGGYNHVRTEQVNVTNGTFSVTENWILSSGLSTETYKMNTTTSNSDPFVTVSIDGTIKGMSNIPPDQLGDSELTAVSGAYSNALKKYNAVSNVGRFGLTSDIYKRANNLVAVELNSQPVSLSLATNQYTGEITYNLSFNNRPINVVSGAIAESITVSDTYPGDLFAVIPVIGRSTGPILQYVGGRTEYKRDVSVNLTMDYTKIPYGSGRNSLLLKKPSLVEPTASQIATILSELSPEGEPGVRKYFISAPSETWNPKEGTYSFNISWTYELDR